MGGVSEEQRGNSGSGAAIQRSPGPDVGPDGLSRRARWLRVGLGAVSGLLAAAVSLGVAELAAAAARPEASPVLAVGGAAIDRTPVSLKDYAVRHFGTNDKLL